MLWEGGRESAGGIREAPPEHSASHAEFQRALPVLLLRFSKACPGLSQGMAAAPPGRARAAPG